MTGPPKAPELRQVAAWWLAARGNRRLPDRCDLDPVDLGPLLPYIWLIEVLPEHESCAYRYRLGGQHIEDTFGFSLRGKLLNEVIEPHVYGMVQRRCDHVVKGPGVCHVAGRVYMHVGLYREGERLILPLGPDDAGPATPGGSARSTPGACRRRRRSGSRSSGTRGRRRS